MCFFSTCLQRRSPLFWRRRSPATGRWAQHHFTHSRGNRRQQPIRPSHALRESLRISTPFDCRCHADAHCLCGGSGGSAPRPSSDLCNT